MYGIVNVYSRVKAAMAVNNDRPMMYSIVLMWLRWYKKLFNQAVHSALTAVGSISM